MANLTTAATEENPFVTGKNSPRAHGSMEDDAVEEYGEDFETSSGSEYEIEEAVREDMDRLENILRSSGMRFRMIDRIGEGKHSKN